jgi:hypothetical protein
MSVSLEYLTSCSAKTGYQVVPLEKAVRLGELAGDMARHPFLGSVLALKGGTALNLCFGPPKRLSMVLRARSFRFWFTALSTILDHPLTILGMLGILAHFRHSLHFILPIL